MDQLVQQLANGIMAGSIYGLLAVSLALVFGVLDVPQFAFGSFGMLGAYTVTLLAQHSYWLGVLAAMVVIGILGIVTQFLVFDPLRNAPSATLFVGAFALVLVLQGLAILLFGPNNRTVAPAVTGKVQFLGALITYQRIIVIAVTLVAVLALNLFLRRTSMGRMIRASGQSRTGALVVGLSPRKIGMMTMAIGSALAGLAGALLAPISQVYPTVGDNLVVKAFIIIVLAGMGSINGALIGGYIVGLSESLGSAYISLTFKDAYPLILLVIILILRPQGLFGRKVRAS